MGQGIDRPAGTAADKVAEIVKECIYFTLLSVSILGANLLETPASTITSQVKGFNLLPLLLLHDK